VLLVWEDVHWADPSSLDLLRVLIDQLPTAQMLMVLTFRPEFLPPWGNRSYLTPLMLNRLDCRQGEMMVQKVTRTKGLPAEVVHHIVTKTDGVPLFVEELTKMVVESGFLREQGDRYELSGPLPPLAIPASLQDSLLARLDQLSTAREVAQIGAVLGREFTWELIRAVVPGEEETVSEALATLVEAEALYRRGVEPEMSYLFKHALIQDAAYQSLLKSKRQQYHQRIALALEGSFSGTKTTEPEVIAHHYTEAGLVVQALPYWQQAGQNAIQRSANSEAIGHLSKALEVMETLPETTERTQTELAILLALGVPLMATKGYAAAEVEQTYRRARVLSQRMGETPHLFPVLGGLFAFYLVRGELGTARTLAEQCLPLAENVGNVAFQIEAHRMSCHVTFSFLSAILQAVSPMRNGR
jgi:predicted ATPase